MNVQRLLLFLGSIAVALLLIWVWRDGDGEKIPPTSASSKSTERTSGGSTKGRVADLTDMEQDVSPKQRQHLLKVEGVGEIGYDVLVQGKSASDLLIQYGLEGEARGTDPNKIKIDFYTDEDGVIKHVAVNRGLYPAESTSEETWKQIEETGISVSRKRVLFASMESEVFMKSLLYWMSMRGAYMSMNYMLDTRVTPVEVLVHDSWRGEVLPTGRHPGLIFEQTMPRPDTDLIMESEKDKRVEKRTSVYVMVPGKNPDILWWALVSQHPTWPRKIDPME